MGNVGDGQGEGSSSLMKERSGYLLTSISATLSGDDEGTKPSGLSRADESWTLRGKTQRRKKYESMQWKKEKLFILPKYSSELSKVKVTFIQWAGFT